MLENVLVSLRSAARPAENALEALLIGQIRKSKRKEVDVAHDDRLPAGRADRRRE